MLAITDLGREVVLERIGRLLSTPDADATLFTAALSFISCLPPKRAAGALGERRDALTLRVEQLETDLSNVPARLPRILLVEAEHELASTRSELSWVRDLLQEIDAGCLTWPTDVAMLTGWIDDEVTHPS